MTLVVGCGDSFSLDFLNPDNIKPKPARIIQIVKISHQYDLVREELV